MKTLKYKVNGYMHTFDPETEEEVLTPSLAEVVIENPTSADIEKAKEIAYQGEYFIEDDGVEEVTAPSQLDQIEAQVTYTAMMTDTLLEV